jgi:hypothetical protein
MIAYKIDFRAFNWIAFPVCSHTDGDAKDPGLGIPGNVQE